ncbi:hypothetical protein Mgra_00001660 [Meloidogyne graminicola]|uniref:Uncharacterized protein n=1 Tax=Meloidogyne graminicola TaxID=189291 RepID=A0A8S9ZYT9_9BILA|nr:hypothetical protein Mgra_00001660 [Meloidogyne graminicola]
MGESEVQIGDDPSNNSVGQQQTYWSQTGQQQRIRILGIGGGNNVERGIPQLHPNAPYFDDEMDEDDEIFFYLFDYSSCEFDDEEDSAEMDDELGAQVTI